MAQKNDETPAPQKPQEDELRKLVAAAVGEAIMQALPVAVGTVASMQKQTMSPKEVKEVQEFSKGQRCATCRQLLRACKGKHRMAVVFPNNEAIWHLWPGARLNGVLYDSGDPGNPIPIPVDWDVESMISMWSEREIINIRGRKKTRRSGFVDVQTGDIQKNPEPVGF